MAGARALWRATGMKDGDFEKPIIAVVNSFTQFVPGHVHLKDLGQLVAREIEKAYNAMKQSVESDNRSDFSQADIEFHAAIYRATHNLIWAQSANILQPSIHLVIKKSNSTAEELGDSLQRHYQILECIRLRKPTEAFDAAVHVLDRTAHDLNIKNSSDEDEMIKLVKAKTWPDES